MPPLKKPEANRRGSLPWTVASVKDVERVYGISAKFVRIIRESGKYPDCFDRSGRVEVLPLFGALNDLLKKIPREALNKSIGSNGFAELDKHDAQAQVAAQEVIRRTRENALANKQLLTRDGIEAELIGPLSMIGAAWKNFGKVHGQKLKSYLIGLGIPNEQIQPALEIVINGVEEPMRHLNEIAKKKLTGV